MNAVQWDTEARMEQVLGGPPRLEPLPQGEIGEVALRAIRDLQEVNGNAADVPVNSDFATLGRHPELLAAFLDFGVKFLADTALPPRERELAILRTGWLCGAPFEFGEHVRIGKEAGLTSEEIDRVKQGSLAPGWSELDRAVLKACEELHSDSMISDATWVVLEKHFDERQLIELPILAGQYHKVAYIQNTMRFRTRACNAGLMAR
jgi:4-carboxymuconolactone decarboxylase